MNNNLGFFSLIIPLMLLLSQTQTQAQERLRVIDKGTDGDVRYYSVVCPSGKRTSVSDRYKEGEICTMPVSAREEICREGWDIDSAATEACK